MKKLINFISFVILSGIVIFVSLNIYNSLKAKKELTESYNFNGTYEIMDFDEKYSLPPILQIRADEWKKDYDEKKVKREYAFSYYNIETSEKRINRSRKPGSPYTCYLCRIKSHTELVLLDENNNQVGTVTVSLGKADWLRRRPFEYVLDYKGEEKRINKVADVTFFQGKPMIESKYYNGKIA